jgi:hypothetical protein
MGYTIVRTFVVSITKMVVSLVVLHLQRSNCVCVVLTIHPPGRNSLHQSNTLANEMKFHIAILALLAAVSAASFDLQQAKHLRSLTEYHDEERDEEEYSEDSGSSSKGG